MQVLRFTHFLFALLDYNCWCHTLLLGGSNTAGVGCADHTLHNSTGQVLADFLNALLLNQTTSF
jgi:hypothetical protein